MFKRILVPLDGSPLAEQALPLAATLAGRLNGDIVLFSALAEDDHFGDSESAREAVAIGRAAAADYLARQKSVLTSGGIDVETRLSSGRPHSQIASACKQERIDLVVMTTHGRSGVARLTLGSVADKVLRTSSAPVILVHPTVDGPPVESIDRIIVALDGSELAEFALPVAEELARELGCEIKLVRAVLPPMAFYAAEYIPGPVTLIDLLEKDASEYVQKAAAAMRGKGLSVSGVTGMDNPAEFIHREARPGDLIVMTTHGRSGVDRWFLGSVADAVVRRGDIPVLLLPAWGVLQQRGSRKSGGGRASTTLVPAGTSRHDTHPLAVKTRKPKTPARRAERPEMRGRQFR
jgi:nucleotide-binding universal stress UspA family protein